MQKVYIVAAKRTAIGAFGGSLKDIGAAKLCAHAIEGAVQQAGVNKDEINQTIVGNILQAGQGMGPGRQASIYAGIPDTVPAYAVNMLCASGMKTVMIGESEIKSGHSDLIAACGTENMSQAPYLLPYQTRFGSKLGHLQLLDHMILDGLTDVFNQYHMGITAENIARSCNISRQEQDKFAALSQQKAKLALQEKRFKDEIVPLEIKKKKESIVFDQDEYPRFDTSVESLSHLRPAFEKEGTVTAGNASGINDGASAIILASEDKVKQLNLKPLARIIGSAQAGIDPRIMGLGPVPAIGKLLEKTSLSLKEIELFELNEAFAAQSLGVIQSLAEKHNTSAEWIAERCNVNGGAIALGHPIGASGNRIIVTLLYEMKKRNLNYGLASLCVGGGMGTAVLLKNCQ